MAKVIFFDEASSLFRREDRRCDVEWSTFNAVPWDDMIPEERERACVVAEAQGVRLKSLMDRTGSVWQK